MKKIIAYITFRRSTSENTNYLHFFDGEWGYNFSYESKNEKAAFGYNAGIGGEFRLGSKLSAEVDLMIDVARISTKSSFTMHYVSYDYPQPNYRDIGDYHLSYRYNFVALPVCLLYRIKDTRAYFGAGIQPALLMSYAQWDNQKDRYNSGAENMKQGLHAKKDQTYLFWTVKAGLEGPELKGSKGRIFMEPFFSMQIGDTMPFEESLKTLPSKQLWSAGLRIGLKI